MPNTWWKVPPQVCVWCEMNGYCCEVTGEWFKFDCGDEQSGKWRVSIHWAIWVEVELKARGLRARSELWGEAKRGTEPLGGIWNEK